MQLIIAHVGPETTEADVADLCRAYASIQDIRLEDSLAGRQRKLALVEFGDAGEAAQAIAALDGTEFAGRAIRVREASRTSSAARATPPQPAVLAPTASRRALPRRIEASAEPNALGAMAARAARAAGSAGFYVMGTLLLILGLGCRLPSEGFKAAGGRAIRASGWRHPLVHRGAGEPAETLPRSEPRSSGMPSATVPG